MSATRTKERAPAGPAAPAVAAAPTAPTADADGGSLAGALDLGTAELGARAEDLTGRTYRALKELIVTRAVPAGGKVTAEGLSQRFGVSRTTAKAAIDQLAAEGLLDVRPQVGTFIRGLTSEDVRALWDVRQMLEAFAVQSGVIAATEAQRAEMRCIADELVPLVEGEEYRADAYEHTVALNRRLHQLFIESAHNPYLQAMHRQIQSHVHIVDYHSRIGLRRADLAVAEHRTIVDAYERRDPELAAETVRRHVERSREVVLAAVARLSQV